ncbi:hypothetical protein [Vibrio neptunius]|uniref:Uncharacterized protein n=1 Tax=Vibrio neptunius TaxID=170651 RepID=A0ABS2ZYH6_9VIBR|nr:hypothetical protein [Vibrio neptunius]MBN3514985.1 hypothetical protein [Vibrio neptunius]MBN3548755.1 hypothetical protein [Vibrio neptunius]MBN3577113.1 hypothetical protein [Vibrio neptunius]MCH9870778.1 hypothetical protein [Vibrio neptunius]
MKKRLLPIPLILLIPIFLLIVVTIAGLYRFSLSDEEIMAKFPNQMASSDAVMKSVFGLSTMNPWTVKVPESQAYTFMEELNPTTGLASGTYEDGEERGVVTVDTSKLLQVTPTIYASIMTVSNQGSGVFNYLVTFHYDEFRKRMISKEAQFLGDRIIVDLLEKQQHNIVVRVKQRDADQSMSQEPVISTTILFKLNGQDSLERVE